MNERIRELARESGLVQYDTDSKMQDIKRFAELIVRDCAGLCSIAAPGRDAEAIEEAILKHFGVE